MYDRKLSSLSHLLGGSLTRYGISERVLAARIVTRANELLQEFMGRQADDVRVLSFKDQELILACGNATARYAAEGLAKKLARRLEEQFPDQTFKKISCRLNTRLTSDDEWYNGTAV